MIFGRCGSDKDQSRSYPLEKNLPSEVVIRAEEDGDAIVSERMRLSAAEIESKSVELRRC